MKSEVRSDYKADYSLLAPGPVNLHPEVIRSLAQPMIHHRTPEFDKILKKVLQNIKKIFQTKEDVFLLSSTGSGGLEALLVNTLSPGDKVLAIVCGKFGERWAEMAKVYGAEVSTIVTEWGEAVNPQLIADHLQIHPDTRLVLCQACETSTAVANPIKEIAAIVNQHKETLFLVDAITALGAYPIPMDEWKIDGLVAGSQKAFMLPTGMAFLSLSQKAWQFVEKAKTPRFYFDLRKEKKANSSGETYYSSNVMVVRALDTVLDLILSQGLEKLFHDIHRRAEFIRIFGQKLGLHLYSKSPSDSVTALTVPASMDGQKVRLYLEESHNITIMGGQDQAKGKIIRVGHMGYIQDKELIHFVESLGHTLHHFEANFITREKINQITLEAKLWLEQNP